MAIFLLFPLNLAFSFGSLAALQWLVRRRLDPIALRSRMAQFKLALLSTLVLYVVVVVPFVVSAFKQGVPVDTGVIEVIDGRPAQKAGIQSGDRVVAIDGQQTRDFLDVSNAVKSYPDEELRIDVERAGTRLHFLVTPTEGKIGVKPRMGRKSMPVGAALRFGIAAPVTTAVSLAKGYIAVMSGSQSAEFSGPIGVARAVEAGEANAFYVVGLYDVWAFPFLVLTAFLVSFLWLPARVDEAKAIDRA